MENFKRNFKYALILVGGVLALYEQSADEHNQYLLILGLGMLMTGIYLTSRGIPSKQEESNNSNDEDGL